MRSDGRDTPRLVPRRVLPAVDHEANAPISAPVQLAAWLGRLRGGRADEAAGS